MSARYVPVVVVVDFDAYQVLAAYIEQTELTAEMRELLEPLFLSNGWTKEAVFLSSMLASAAKHIAEGGAVMSAPYATTFLSTEFFDLPECKVGDTVTITIQSAGASILTGGHYEVLEIAPGGYLLRWLLCESCGTPADLRLDDDSNWCVSCDAMARISGLDNRPARLL